MNVARTSGLRAKANVYATVGVPLQLGPDVAALEFEPAGSATGSRGGATATRSPDRSHRGAAAGQRDPRAVDHSRRRMGTVRLSQPAAVAVWQAAGSPTQVPRAGPGGQMDSEVDSRWDYATREGVVPGELTVTLAASGADLEIALSTSVAPS